MASIDDTAAQPPDRRSEMIPIWQGTHCARWMVSVASEFDPDNHWSGWLDIDGQANDGTVQLGEWELTPVEARNAAMALILAANHAEHFHAQSVDVLQTQQQFVAFDLGEGAPIETHRAVHGWIRKAEDRIRRQGNARKTAPAAPVPAGDTA